MHALHIVALALVVAALGASGAFATDQNPARPGQPVVVKVEDGGFQWEDAGLGAAAGVAASVFVVALGAWGRHHREEER